MEYRMFVNPYHAPVIDMPVNFIKLECGILGHVYTCEAESKDDAIAQFSKLLNDDIKEKAKHHPGVVIIEKFEG